MRPTSEFPPINLLETLVEPDLIDELFDLEGLTNERLRDQVGAIVLVDREDRVCAPGSTPMMAAFTHIGVASRFSDGSFGVYYAAINSLMPSRHAGTTGDRVRDS